MISRAAILTAPFVVALAPTRAQSQGGPPPTAGVNLVQLANQVAALQAPVDKLEVLQR